MTARREHLTFGKKPEPPFAALGNVKMQNMQTAVAVGKSWENGMITEAVGNTWTALTSEL